MIQLKNAALDLISTVLFWMFASNTTKNSITYPVYGSLSKSNATMGNNDPIPIAWVSQSYVESENNLKFTNIESKAARSEYAYELHIGLLHQGSKDGGEEKELSTTTTMVSQKRKGRVHQLHYFPQAGYILAEVILEDSHQESLEFTGRSEEEHQMNNGISTMMQFGIATDDTGGVLTFTRELVRRSSGDMLVVPSPDGTLLAVITKDDFISAFAVSIRDACNFHVNSEFFVRPFDQKNGNATVTSKLGHSISETRVQWLDQNTLRFLSPRVNDSVYYHHTINVNGEKQSMAENKFCSEGASSSSNAFRTLSDGKEVRQLSVVHQQLSDDMNGVEKIIEVKGERKLAYNCGLPVATLTEAQLQSTLESSSLQKKCKTRRLTEQTSCLFQMTTCSALYGLEWTTVNKIQRFKSCHEYTCEKIIEANWS